MGFLVIENLCVNYEEKRIVKSCSFKVKQGEIIVILGASGDGKTTLLKTIAGLLPRKKGGITFDGVKVNDPTEQLVPGHSEIKLVNQDFGLNEYHTVEENIRLRLLSFDQKYQDERIRKLLRLTGLTKHRDKKSLEISGGQRQRLAIARALADEPELLLLDEPFNQLDFQTKNKIATHIKGYLKKNHISAIMVTHNGIEAMKWADRILYMEEGRIVRDDSPDNFFNNPSSTKEANFFGALNQIKFQDGKIGYFRPSFFRLEKDETHILPIDAVFFKKENLGWYATYYFKVGKDTVFLYSATDISHVKRVYIRLIQFPD